MNQLKVLFVLGVLAAGMAISPTAGAESPAPGADTAQLRVGVFDSRAVTAAFAASKQFDRELRRARSTKEGQGRR